MTDPQRRGPRALITGHSHSREALAAARALGAQGWTVGVGTAARVGLARASRWASRWHRVAPPSAGADAFLASVEQAIRDGGYDVVFGAGDPEMLALSWGRGRLSAVVPHATHERVVRAVDKWSLTAAAIAAGVRVPHTALATDTSIAAWRGGAVVKPRLHWTPDPREDASWLAATVVHDPAEIAAHVARITGAGHAALLQEAIAGRLTAVITLTDRDGTVVARMQQQAQRTYPADGISARAVTVPVDPVLAERVDALLADLEWFGLAQLQFLSPAPGEYRLIDFNGRFYGSLALAVGAGLNLPAAWGAMALGLHPPPLRSAVVGQRYVWLGGDLRRAWSERRGGLAADLLGTLSAARGATNSIASRHDPVPALVLPLAIADGQRARLVGGTRRRVARWRAGA